MSLKKDDPRLRFGQPRDATVIDERLIDESLKETGESGKPYYEIKFLSLSYRSKLLAIFTSKQQRANRRHQRYPESGWFGQAREATA